MKTNIDLIGIGDPFLDLVVDMERLPKPNVNVRMHNYCYQGGGNVPTALVAASRMGLKCAIVGMVSDDTAGRSVIADFQYNGVDTSHLVVDPGKRTNFCLCITEREINSKEFISKSGECRPLEVSDLPENLIRSAKMLHIGQFTPAVIQACEWIHAAAGKVSIDAAYYRPDIYENYRHLDIFIGSETYYDAIPGKPSVLEAMHAIQQAGPEIVIFTFGGDGCCGVYGDREFELPAFPVKVADSTGAGDVFHGAFDYAYLQGWDVESCARFASAVSAIKCTRPGGRAGIPTLPVVQKFLESGIIDYSEIDERVKQYMRGF